MRTRSEYCLCDANAIVCACGDKVATIPASVYVSNLHGGLVLAPNGDPLTFTVLARYTDDGALLVSCDQADTTVSVVGATDYLEV